MMQVKDELQEVIQKLQHIAHKMGGSMGQRGYYGMRGGSGYGSGSYNTGGNFGQREPWMQGGYPPQEGWQNVDPRWFM